MAERSVAIYTALLGGYDRLLEQPTFPGVDFICFTDDPGIESETWEVRQLPSADDHRRAARRIKTSPHDHLPDHEWSLWIDARLSIRSDSFVERMLTAAGTTGMSVMAHRQRRDVYEEAAHVYRVGFDSSAALVAQVRRYRAKGLPLGSGLYSTMSVARRSADPVVRHLDDRWWEEIEAGSVRDQVALPFVVWESGVNIGVVDLDPYANELYVLHHHLEPRRYPPGWKQRLADARFTVLTGLRTPRGVS